MKASTVAGTLAFCLLLGSCSRLWQRNASIQSRESFVTVVNNHHLDVVIYAVRSGVKFRVGTVRGFSSDTLALSRSIVGVGTNLRLLVDPIGTPNTHLTDAMAIGPDHWIDLRVTSPLNFSHYSIWYQ